MSKHRSTRSFGSQDLNRKLNAESKKIQGFVDAVWRKLLLRGASKREDSTRIHYQQRALEYRLQNKKIPKPNSRTTKELNQPNNDTEKILRRDSGPLPAEELLPEIP